MKTRLLLISVLILTFYSCQNEEMEVSNPASQNISAKSPLKSLLERVSQNPTSNDNILDNSSCFSVQLPVTVIVNGQNIVVSSSSDYATVQANLDSFSNDDDIVNFVYPITVTLQNFQNVVLNSPDDLENLIDGCGEEDSFDEIDCIALNYPFLINFYNAETQTPSFITINSNSELFNFLQDMNDNEYMTISYPIIGVNAEGQNITITNNSQLENFIEDSVEECDDDSDTPTENNAAFVAVITNGNWKVDYFFDDTDETASFNGYSFTFNADGSSVAVRNATIIGGEWLSFIDGSILKFKLSYQGDLLDKLEEDWKIIEFSDSRVRLKKSDADEDNEYLYFTRN